MTGARRRILVVEDDPETASSSWIFSRRAGMPRISRRTATKGCAGAVGALRGHRDRSDAAGHRRDSRHSATARSRHGHAGLDRQRARRGRRSRARAARRRRRLSRQAVCVRGIAGARRGAGAPQRDRGQGDGLAGRGSRTGPRLRTVNRGGRAVELLPREFQVLEYLVRNEGHVVSRAMLLEHVWDLHFDPTTNIIDVYVGRVRRKVDSEQAYPLIHTIRGVGFCVRAPR